MFFNIKGDCLKTCCDDVLSGVEEGGVGDANAKSIHSMIMLDNTNLAIGRGDGRI